MVAGEAPVAERGAKNNQPNYGRQEPEHRRDLIGRRRARDTDRKEKDRRRWRDPLRGGHRGSAGRRRSVGAVLRSRWSTAMPLARQPSFS